MPSYCLLFPSLTKDMPNLHMANGTCLFSPFPPFLSSTRSPPMLLPLPTDLNSRTSSLPLSPKPVHTPLSLAVSGRQHLMAAPPPPGCPPPVPPARCPLMHTDPASLACCNLFPAPPDLQDQVQAPWVGVAHSRPFMSWSSLTFPPLPLQLQRTTGSPPCLPLADSDHLSLNPSFSDTYWLCGLRHSF